MSYDASLKIDSGGAYPTTVADCGNMTYNVWPMYERALGPGGVESLNNRLGGDVIATLERAVSDMSHPANVRAYDALNPKNGWGDRQAAIRFLQAILDGCREHPKATLHVT